MSKEAAIAFVRELPSVRAFPTKRNPKDSRAISSLFLLPYCTAVYFVIDQSGTVQYIGATKNLRTRWFQHHWRYKFQQLQNARVAWAEVRFQDLATVESQFIRKLRPSMNVNIQRYPKLRSLR